MTLELAGSGHGRPADAATDDLLIDRFEVTDGEFAEFLASSGYAPESSVAFLTHWPQRDGRPAAPPPAALDLPVRLVSLEDALAYARWRGKEIPTSEEWLRACPSLRDGVLPWRGRAFAGACNSLVSGLDGPMPVGSYELGRSPAGCYDMVGNVREWTTSQATRDGIAVSGKVVVMGGSFRQPCSPDGKEAADGLDPWLEHEWTDVRQSDLGFRCVIRGAQRVLSDAFDQVDALQGEERRAAIAELLRVGQRDYGENVLLPLVRGRAFERRVRWSVELTQGPDAPLRGQRVGLLAPAPKDASDGVLLAVGERALLRIARADGRVLGRLDVPHADAAFERERLIAPGGATALWSEGRRGEIALVEIESGRVASSAPAPDRRDVLASWNAGDATAAPGDPGAAAWFVQQLDSLSDERGKPLPGDLPCTRIVRFGADGVREQVVPGETLPPPPADASGLMLLLQHRVDALLPVAGDRQQPRPDPFDPTIDRSLDVRVTAFDWISLELFRSGDLSRAARWWVTWEPRIVDVVLAPGHPQRLRWLHWRFIPDPTTGGDAKTLDLDAPDDVQRSFVATTVGATSLFDAGNGRFLLLQARDGVIEPPRELRQPDGRVADIALLPAGLDDRFGPYLLASGGSALARLAADGPVVSPAVAGLAVSGALSWSALSPSRRHLVLRMRSGRWLGWDLEQGALGFTLDAAGDTAIHPDLLAYGGAESLVCQSTPMSAWLRALEDGALQDELGVARPPISQVLAIEPPSSGARGRPEPVVLFEDGRLAALGPPEPASARLVADFIDVARATAAAAPRSAVAGGR